MIRRRCRSRHRRFDPATPLVAPPALSAHRLFRGLTAPATHYRPCGPALAQFRVKPLSQDMSCRELCGTGGGTCPQASPAAKSKIENRTSKMGCGRSPRRALCGSKLFFPRECRMNLFFAFLLPSVPKRPILRASKDRHRSGEVPARPANSGERPDSFAALHPAWTACEHFTRGFVSSESSPANPPR